MKASAYLKAKLDSERKLAVALDKGVKASPKVVGMTINDIYSGMERASWYSSCFFDEYQDICDELAKEDIRMVLAIIELYKRKDVIFDILELYVNHVMDKPDKLKVDVLLKHTGEWISKNTVNKTTKKALTYAITKGLAESYSVSASVRKYSNAQGYKNLNFFQLYGQVHKAALSARRLKMIEPRFYKLLYHFKVEMLYIYIEPALSNIINEIKSIHRQGEITISSSKGGV